MPSPAENSLGRRLIVYKNKLVVIGGEKDDRDNFTIAPVATVQYYDFVERTWITLKDMDVERTHHAVAVVSGQSSDSPFYFNL